MDGRIVKVRVQPRIETLASGLGERVAERVLEPVGHPIVRHVLRPSWYARGATVPQTAWLRLVPPEQGVLQQKVRARDAAVRLTYRVKPDTLGRVVRVDVPGREPTLHRVVSTVGELRFGVLPGTTDVSIDGLGSSDEAWMSAVPSEGGRIYRTQQICELPVGRTLAFRFDRRPGELLAILVFVVSESTSRQFEFNYDIDPGKKWEMGQRLYRRLTERSGSIHGAVEPSNRVLIWEAEREPMPTGTLPHAMGVVRIPLGDDLRPGDHKIQLAFTTKVGPPLWVRAVLVGRRRSSDWGTDE